MIRPRSIALLAIAAHALSMLSTAASARSSQSVSCALATTPLEFGEYTAFGGASSDFTATITVTCATSASAAEPWDGTIALIGGGGASGRQLGQGTQRLAYSLYLDPARTLPWGDGSSGGAVRPLSGMVGSTTPYRQTIIVYGRIPALQATATPGRYSDQIVAMLEY